MSGGGRDEGEGFLSEGEPVEFGGGRDDDPFFQEVIVLTRVETGAEVGSDEGIDSGFGKFDDEGAANEHGEDFVIDFEGGRAEAGAVGWWGDAWMGDEGFDDSGEALFGCEG